MRAERHRPWYRLKWAGLTACLALLIILVAMVAVQKIEIEGKSTGLWVFNGCVLVFHQPVGTGLTDRVWSYWKVDLANNPKPWPQYGDVTFKTDKLVYVSIPLNSLLLVLTIVTVVLWRLGRRFPAGCCQDCGYDLTGNVSGVCPECGEQVRATASMKADVGLDEP